MNSEVDQQGCAGRRLERRGNGESNLEVAQKQRDLTKAGAWTYDILLKSDNITHSKSSQSAARCLRNTRCERPGMALSWRFIPRSAASFRRKAPTTHTRKA